MLGRRVLEQFSQLQRVFADLLHWSQQEAIQGDVDHFLKQSAGLKEVHILAELGEARELHAGIGVIVAVLGVDLEVCLLGKQLEVRTADSCSPGNSVTGFRGRRSMPGVPGCLQTSLGQERAPTQERAMRNLGNTSLCIPPFPSGFSSKPWSPYFSSVSFFIVSCDTK